MGQSSSRNSPQTVPPSNQHENSSLNAALGAHDDQSDLTSATALDSVRGSQRPSVRRSILNIVKPRSRVNSAASASGGINTRKSWRNLRRYSKAPNEVNPALASSSGTLAEEQPAASQTSLASVKGKERVQPSPEMPSSSTEAVPDRPSTPFSPANAETLSQPEADASQNIGTWLGGQDSRTSDTREHETMDDQVDGDDDQPTLPEPSFAPPASLPEQPNSDTGPPRQFPPPGTLVVVQGIVHTNDVSRNPTLAPPVSHQSRNSSTRRASSTPRPATPVVSGGAGRNRLSTLLRSRPASTISSRPPSAAPPSDLNVNTIPSLSLNSSELEVDPGNFDSSEEIPANASNPHSGSQSSLNPQVAQVPPSFTPQFPARGHSQRPPAISSNSIDVLGTLLSVAAAATAASLLTGSSEPILSSGLAPPGAGSTNPLGTANPASRPNSPTPTAGLGDMSAAGRAERMRQAWGTIRERLGLRSGNTDATTDERAGVNEAAPRAGATDTRELMLAEMARAFNVGLGLGASAGSTTTAGGTDGSTSSDAEAEPTTDETPTQGPPNAPAEGSFERFLVDLQSDLRTALAQDGNVFGPIEDGSTPMAQDRNVTTSNEDVNPTAPAQTSPTSNDDHEDVNERLETSSRADADSLPDLEALSESGTEFDDDEEEYGRGAPLVNGPPDLHIEEPATTAGSGRIDAHGRINWWRLYRFPPIMSPRAPVDTNTPPPSGTTTSPLNEPLQPIPLDPPQPEVTMSSPVPSNDISSTAPPAPVPPAAANSTVIPVIVVGLQSVNGNWRPDVAPSDNEGMDIFGAPIDSENPEEMNDLDAFRNQNQQGRGRGRGWQTRAADALRNLRPGRRPASRGATHPMIGGPGSRTFLIYVIGGYYPPDHSIVTGGPNNLESFEALLELADLLGQVKPPTASKEEIANSGLEIIKPVQLAEHEKNGKIASNCVDRCLICLDDYAVEDDIRVMSCRHAFHQSCVDKWLQTGRNNCPACRTKGVSTDSTNVPHRPPPAEV